MNTKVLLIRHGEVYNPKNIEYIRSPGFGLSKNGVNQAKKLHHALRNMRISKIYSSPLSRARDTAEILSANKIPIETIKEINEVNFKKWQGLNRDKRDKDELKGYKEDPIRFSAFLGESIIDVQKRVVSKIEELAKKNQGDVIALVFHEDPIITAVLHYKKRPLKELKKNERKHASVTSIIFDDKLQCRKVTYREYVKTKDFRK